MSWRQLSERPRSITIVVILQIVYGGWLLIFPLTAAFRSLSEGVPPETVTLQYIFLVWAVPSFFIAYNLYMGKAWVWSGMVALHISSIVFFGFILIAGASGLGTHDFMYAVTVFGTVGVIAPISAITLWYTLRPTTRGYFGKAKL